MKNKSGYKNKGLTLIEVIISLGILGILLGGTAILLGFGTNTFSSGTKQYDIQSNIRLADEHITKQIRFATDIKIIGRSDVPEAISLGPYQNYIYFDDSNKCITHINKYFTKKIKLGEGGSIEFKSITPYEELCYIMTAKEKNQRYNIENKLAPMNIKLGEKKCIDGSESEDEKSGQAIYFKTASDYLAYQLRPYVESGSINSDKELEVQYNRKIEKAEIIEYQNVTNPSITHGSYVESGMGAGYIKISTTETKNGAVIVFRVTFKEDIDYEPISDYMYDYNISYDSSSKTWDIR